MTTFEIRKKIGKCGKLIDRVSNEIEVLNINMKTCVSKFEHFAGFYEKNIEILEKRKLSLEVKYSNLCRMIGRMGICYNVDGMITPIRKLALLTGCENNKAGHYLLTDDPSIEVDGSELVFWWDIDGREAIKKYTIEVELAITSIGEKVWIGGDVDDKYYPQSYWKKIIIAGREFSDFNSISELFGSDLADQITEYAETLI